MGPQLSRELMDAQLGVFVRATPGQTEKSEKNHKLSEKKENISVSSRLHTKTIRKMIRVDELN